MLGHPDVESDPVAVIAGYDRVEFISSLAQATFYSISEWASRGEKLWRYYPLSDSVRSESFSLSILKRFSPQDDEGISDLTRSRSISLLQASEVSARLERLENEADISNNAALVANNTAEIASLDTAVNGPSGLIYSVSGAGGILERLNSTENSVSGAGGLLSRMQAVDGTGGLNDRVTTLEGASLPDRVLALEALDLLGDLATTAHPVMRPQILGTSKAGPFDLESFDFGSNGLSVVKSSLGSLSALLPNTAVFTSNSLGALSSGGNFTFAGVQVAAQYASGWNTTAIGTSTMANRTYGNFITAIGTGAFGGTAGGGGHEHTCIGAESGHAITTGQANITCVGFEAGSSGTLVDDAVYLGNPSTTRLFVGASEVSLTSDERDKTDISDLEACDSFLMSLRPRSFKYDPRARYYKREFDEASKSWARTPVSQDGSKSDKRRRVGFVAQEVATSESAFGLTGLMVDSDTPDNLSVKPLALIPVLVQAVQKLRSELDALKSTLDVH